MENNTATTEQIERSKRITSRTRNTVEYLRDNPQVFDRITKDGTGGRVRWHGRMPRNYDNKAGLPWSLIRGRYWYPW